MNPAKNKLLWKFSEANAPEKWTSKQAKRIYDAAIAAEKSGAWTEYAVGGSVRVAWRSQSFIEGAKLAPYGTCDKFARAYIEMHLERLEQDIARARKQMEVYGAHAFVQPLDTLTAPNHPFDAEERILDIIRRKPAYLWVHGIRFAPDASGAYVRVN